MNAAKTLIVNDQVTADLGEVQTLKTPGKRVGFTWEVMPTYETKMIAYFGLYEFIDTTEDGLRQQILQHICR